MAKQQLGVTTIETAAACADEFAFLAAIMQDYEHELPKLVYADWLEERGDPRGPYLRDCVELSRDPTALIPLPAELSFSWLQIVGLWHRSKIREVIAQGWLREPYATRVEPAYMRTARPTVHMLVTPADDDSLPLGCTKFGGRPDLPTGSEWPVLAEERVPAYGRDRMPLLQVFCAQVRLSDLRLAMVSLELPPDGLMSFFHCGYGGNVLVGPGAESGRLKRCERPSEGLLSRPHQPFEPDFYPLPAGTVRFIEGLELAFNWNIRPLGEEFHNEYQDWYGIDNLVGLPPEFDYQSWPINHEASVHHQLLGHSRGTDNFPDPERMPGMRFLATFGSDDQSAHYWGDNGQPYWIIHETDLAAGRFDAADCTY